jgi:hypothetical protein
VDADLAAAVPSVQHAAAHQVMRGRTVPKNGNRFSDKIMRKHKV